MIGPSNSAGSWQAPAGLTAPLGSTSQPLSVYRELYASDSGRFQQAPTGQQVLAADAAHLLIHDGLAVMPNADEMPHHSVPVAASHPLDRPGRATLDRHLDDLALFFGLHVVGHCDSPSFCG